MSASKDSLSLKKVAASSAENKKCVDCRMARPQWASVTYGIFLCLNCAGAHRSYGVKVSVVKSMGMDVWSLAEVKRMELGGNARFLEHLKKYSLESCSKEELYKSKTAKEYADKLKKSVEEAFPETKAVFASQAPSRKERTKPRPLSTPSPGAVDVKPRAEEALPAYANICSAGATAMPTMETIQTGLTEAFGKAAEYIYSASSTLSEKVIAPASSIIKEKSIQLSEYIRRKEGARKTAQRPAGREEAAKSSFGKPSAEKNKSSLDKWD